MGKMQGEWRKAAQENTPIRIFTSNRNYILLKLVLESYLHEDFIFFGCRKTSYKSEMLWGIYWFHAFEHP